MAVTSALSAAQRSYPTSEVRGGGREEQPHVQGAVAAPTQEGLEELSHLEGQEDPLEEGVATHSSILAWSIPWTEEPGRLESRGSQRV